MLSIPGPSCPATDLPQHALKYHIISDSLSAFKSNAYGQKSIDFTNSIYTKFVKPTFPYLETPAAYAKPYVAKLDQLGDSLLTKVDEKVPIVKSETKEIKETIIVYVSWPIKVAGEQKDYVVKTYSTEYKKNGGDGVVAGGRALVSGSLVITSEYLAYAASLLQRTKKEAESKAKEASEAVKEKTEN